MIIPGQITRGELRLCVRVEDGMPDDHTEGARFVAMLPEAEKELIYDLM